MLQRYYAAIGILALALFIICENTGAFPTNERLPLSAKLIVELAGHTLLPGQQVSIVADTEETELEYHWTLVGPGELLSQEADHAVIYAAPTTVIGKSTIAIVSVRVTDDKDQQVTKSVTFSITSKRSS